MVGDSGFEPLTSTVSRWRSPPELIARTIKHQRKDTLPEETVSSIGKISLIIPLRIHNLS